MIKTGSDQLTVAPKASPRGGKPPQTLVHPSKPLESMQSTPLVAGVGNASGAGMGLGAAARSTALSGLLSQALGQPGCQTPGPGEANLSCAVGAVPLIQNSLGPGVMPALFTFMQFQGSAIFRRTTGRRQYISLTCGAGTSGITAMTDGIAGAINVPVGMTFLVTHFVPMAMINNVGLPGAFESLDPMALFGSVVFGLVSDVGDALNVQTAVTNGECRVNNGTSVLFEAVESGNVPTSFPFSEGSSIRAFYEVTQTVFRCFPNRVAVKVSGFQIPTALLNEAVGNGTAVCPLPTGVPQP